MAWHRSRRADLALRASGLFLCALAYAAIAHLVTLHIPVQSAGLSAYGFAAFGFLGASMGSALAILGNHLFDEIEVAARWRHRRGLRSVPDIAAPHAAYERSDRGICDAGRR